MCNKKEGEKVLDIQKRQAVARVAMSAREEEDVHEIQTGGYGSGSTGDRHCHRNSRTLAQELQEG